MSIYDKASLVLIPSGTKTSKVYSQKPVNGDGDFTFSRSTAATRVNADGNIEKETQNLILNSQNFGDSQYVLGPNISRTTGQTDPNGGNTAVLMSNTGDANGYFYSSVSLQANTINTFSIYIKGSSAGSIAIRLDGSSQGTRYDVNYTTEWTRVSCYQVVDQTNCAVVIGGFNTWTAGENIQFAFAQVEQGLVARDYIETTTAAVEGGITDNVPRLDYTDSSCPALLLEPQRTNLLRNSEFYDGSGSNWNTQLGATITQNNAISPEGLQNASTFSIQPVQYIYTNTGSNSVSGTTYTLSAYIRVASGTKDFVMFTYSGTGNDFSSPTKTATTEWQRFEFTFTAATAALTNLYPVGQDDFAGGDFEIYGVQLEEGSYATSYIPTYGTSVTRNADGSLSLPTTQTLSDFTLYWEGSLLQDGQNMLFGGGTGGWYLDVDASNGRIVLDTNSGRKYEAFSTLRKNQTHKVAMKRTNGVIDAFVDGVKLTPTTQVTDTTALSLISIAWGFSSTYYPKMNLNQVLTIQSALTDQEAIDLTTI